MSRREGLLKMKAFSVLAYIYILLTSHCFKVVSILHSRGQRYSHSHYFTDDILHVKFSGYEAGKPSSVVACTSCLSFDMALISSSFG